MNNQAESIFETNLLETPIADFRFDNKYRITTEAAIRSKVMKTHAIKL